MNTRIITPEAVGEFRAHLVRLDRSVHTIKKYLHDVCVYASFLDGREVTSETTCAYKQTLIERAYKPSSINTMLASLFSFFKFMDWTGCGTQRMNIQKDAYCPESKELTKADYRAMAAAANERDRLVIWSLASSGIRASELQYFTVEAVHKREIQVTCKRKIRTIMIPDDLALALEAYAQEQNITSGIIFRSKHGNPLDRRTIWLIVKMAALRAMVSGSKAFPHNLRKLFARTFVENGGDVTKLSDVLGHSSIETTRIYIKTSGAEHRRLVNSLGLVPKWPKAAPETTKKPRHTHKGRKGKRSKRSKR